MGSPFPPSSRWGSVGRLPRPRGALGSFTNFHAGCQSEKGRLAAAAFSILGVVRGLWVTLGRVRIGRTAWGGWQGQRSGDQLPFGSLLVVAVVQGCGFSFFLGSEQPVLPGSPVLLWAGPVGAGVRTLGPQVCLERAGGHCPGLGARGQSSAGAGGGLAAGVQRRGRG